MHEAFKSSWLGRSLQKLKRIPGVQVYLDQSIGEGVGSRPDVTILIRKLHIGIVLELKSVPKRTFYAGIIPSYRWLYAQGGRTSQQRTEAIRILKGRRHKAKVVLYFYVPYPSFVR